ISWLFSRLKQQRHIPAFGVIPQRKGMVINMGKDLNEGEINKSALLDNLPSMVYRCNFDRDWTMQFVSDASFELTGYKAESLIGNRDLCFNDIIAPEYREYLWIRWNNVLSQRESLMYEYEIITATGQRKWVLETGQGVFNENGDVEALEGIIIDITERKVNEKRNEFLGKHDLMTGLYNREYFEVLLEYELDLEPNVKKAILNINLKKTDLFTLAYGFHYSQELIKKIAAELTTLCTNDCRLFSTYANRFTLYLKNYKDKNDLIQLSEEVVKILITILSAKGNNVGIGILEINEGETDVKKILRDVLIASENSVSNLNNQCRYVFFDKDMELKIIRQAKIKDLLEKIATGNDDYLYLQFQPIYNVEQNRICCFEALSRLKSDELGIVSPLEFIPLSEETKLIIPIGKRIIHKSLCFLRKLIENGNNDIRISINVSAIQLFDNDFTSSLIELIDNADIDPSKVIIEITESVFSDNYHEINEKLNKLKDRGICITIDDFGTGYSSFARERELNIDGLKIEKYFIDGLIVLNPERLITNDIISMAHKLGHCVVAEGVEHEEQMQYLVKHKCDMIQGYLISRPLDEEYAIQLLKNNDFSKYAIKEKTDKK
ncbi:MAG: EAL domain-containing protein, partial [Eubacteriales bacterium]|nr:EAL domain-containing protein [Eubacteriales bacterium]